nr:PepSY-associated TM helix domain-containing protein [uncultured Bacillus sp.]
MDRIFCDYPFQLFEDSKINSGLLYQIWHFPLHTGSFGGILTKILYAAGSLTPSILMFTGIYMWLYKKKKRKQKKSSVLAA